MFTPTDLVQAFRDEFWPVSGTNPALTRRMLKRCVQHPGILAAPGRPLVILAEIQARFEDGSEIGSYYLYADPSTIVRNGLVAQMQVGTRFANGRIAWRTTTFFDAVAHFNLGDYLAGLEHYTITLRPFEGTQTFGVTVPVAASEGPEVHDAPVTEDAPEPVVSALARAEERITTALQEADSVARSALRRHLAKVAHPDTVSPDERTAYDAALGKAFGAIERGHFAFEP
jgi:hypothetical protein